MHGGAQRVSCIRQTVQRACANCMRAPTWVCDVRRAIAFEGAPHGGLGERNKAVRSGLASGGVEHKAPTCKACAVPGSGVVASCVGFREVRDRLDVHYRYAGLCNDSRQ